MDNATVTSTTEAIDVAARLQEFVGQGEGPTTTSVVDPTVVTRLLEALGDRNPVYTDAAAAAASVHGHLVAPVTSLQSWTVSAKPRGRFGTDGHGQAVFRLEAAPAGSASTQSEEEAAAAKAREWGTAIDMREFLKSEGYIAPAVTNGWFEYKRYLRHGERITIGAPLVEEIAGPKRTG
ncbi:MAG: MaoC family dehydratase N-terminal domain-containing protein, partial [Microbacterium sp.]